jgi:NADH-quinone oxidoreductase subunit I
VPEPKAFYIDVDVCMNCGLCAEHSPFDAIKMDHDYEIAAYNLNENIYDLEKLLKPQSYYASIRPVNYAREEAAKASASAA